MSSTDRLNFHAWIRKRSGNTAATAPSREIDRPWGSTMVMSARARTEVTDPARRAMVSSDSRGDMRGWVGRGSAQPERTERQEAAKAQSANREIDEAPAIITCAHPSTGG